MTKRIITNTKHQLSENWLGIKTANKYSITPIRGMIKFRLTLKPFFNDILLLTANNIKVVIANINVLMAILKPLYSDTINPIVRLTMINTDPMKMIDLFMITLEEVVEDSC